MGYKGEIVKGISWITSIRLATRILSLGKTFIVLKILTPNDFGLFGVATLILTFAEIATETGVNIFLIQVKEEIDKYVSTAWITSIIRGFVIAAVIAASAPIVAGFFKSPDVLPLILLISLVPLLRGFINPAIIKFQKDLLFNKEFYYRTSLLLIEVVFSVAFVVVTKDVIGLIWGLLISVLFEVFLSFIVISPRPKFEFDFALFKQIIRFGKWITSSTVFNYFYQHGDDIAVGRMLGTQALGYYEMAYKISLAPLSDISDVISKVTFPVYVKISDDRTRLRRAFLQTLFAICILTIPLGILLYVFSKDIILFFGPQWLPAVPVLKVLAIFGVIRAVSVFVSTFFLSIGKQYLFTLITFIGLCGLLLTIVPFITKWGIVGAGWSALFGTALTIPVVFYFAYRELYTDPQSK